MPVLRIIKSDYYFYHHQGLDLFIAVDDENKQLLSNYWKANKGKQQAILPGLKITGYKLVFDEEFQSLKIDFESTFQFEARELHPTKLQ